MSSPPTDQENGVKISVITPTVGRDTLRRTASSVLAQLEYGDEWIVISDGPLHAAKSIIDSLHDPRVRFDSSEGTACWGNRERDIAIGYANGHRLVFVDDDDELAPDAIRAVRLAHIQYPDKPICFRMFVTQTGDVFWRSPEIRSSNVGTPMFCPINDPARLPKWADGSSHNYASDFIFIRRCCELQGTPIFACNVICYVHHALVRPARTNSTSPRSGQRYSSVKKLNK